MGRKSNLHECAADRHVDAHVTRSDSAYMYARATHTEDLFKHIAPLKGKFRIFQNFTDNAVLFTDSREVRLA